MLVPFNILKENKKKLLMGLQAQTEINRQLVHWALVYWSLSQSRWNSFCKSKKQLSICIHKPNNLIYSLHTWADNLGVKVTRRKASFKERCVPWGEASPGEELDFAAWGWPPSFAKKKCSTLSRGGPRAQRNPKSRSIPRKRMNGTFNGGHQWRSLGTPVEGPYLGWPQRAQTNLVY